MSPEELIARNQELEELLTARDATIAEQQSLIDQLKRMLFGPKSEKMTPEQAAELAAVVADLNEQEKRPETDSQEVLKEEGQKPETDKEPPGERNADGAKSLSPWKCKPRFSNRPMRLAPSADRWGRRSGVRPASRWISFRPG